MFSDLVGSTALSARMDPEDLREVISAYQKCVAETVGRFGGFVAKYMGDGVLIYFGYPQAHEDDAERAVRAGLELVAAVGGLEDPRAPTDACRHRNGSGGCRRSDRLGRFSGAGHRGRDAEPCGALAGHCGAEQRGNCGEHAQARRQPVRASGPWDAGTQGHCRPGASLGRVATVFGRKPLRCSPHERLTELVGREEELEAPAALVEGEERRRSSGAAVW